MNKTIFDEEGWRYTYYRWVVSSGISLRQAISDELKALLSFQNPRVTAVIPQSRLMDGGQTTTSLTF
jgi:hypothetical protein